MDLFQNWRHKQIPHLLNTLFLLGEKVAAWSGNVIIAFNGDAVPHFLPRRKKSLQLRFHPSSRYQGSFQFLRLSEVIFNNTIYSIFNAILQFMLASLHVKSYPRDKLLHMLTPSTTNTDKSGIVWPAGVGK